MGTWPKEIYLLSSIFSKFNHENLHLTAIFLFSSEKNSNVYMENNIKIAIKIRKEFGLVLQVI